jgi:ABC-type branched-subunit amino acid transport system substrate-binding protein
VPPPEVLPAPHQLTGELPSFFRLPNLAADKVPVRVGIILPFNDAAPNARALANAMMKAAELALYDSGNSNIVLMTADDTGAPAEAGAAAKKLLDQGAEIIIGPIFSASVAAVAPLARDRGVPVLAFSTDRGVAGNGVYLLSFQPQSEVERVVAFAAAKGHKRFGAMIPQTAYGDVVEHSFRDAVAASGGTVADIEHFNPSAGTVIDPAAAIAKSGCDAVLIAQGGALLRGIAPTLSYNGVDPAKVQLLGTGLWDDPANAREPLLAGGWFAAPQPSADASFSDRARAGSSGGRSDGIFGRRPGADDVPEEWVLIRQFGDDAVEHQPATRRGGEAAGFLFEHPRLGERFHPLEIGHNAPPRAISL